jgi:hypothetical protein
MTAGSLYGRFGQCWVRDTCTEDPACQFFPGCLLPSAAAESDTCTCTDEGGLVAVYLGRCTICGLPFPDSRYAAGRDQSGQGPKAR